MTWKFERVAGPFAFTEGPVWDGEALLFTDMWQDRIQRYNPRSGRCEVYRTGTNHANGLALDRDGTLLACEGQGRCIARYLPGRDSVILADRFEGRRLNSPNDLSVDQLGRIWFTDPCYDISRDHLELEHDSVFRLDPQPDGRYAIARVTYDTTRPNGIIVNADMTTLYVAQSDFGSNCKRELRAYPIHLDASLGAYEVLHDFGPHRGIDGMTVDENGNIVATAGWEESGPGPMIYVFAPSGCVLETHPVENRPTNCIFGDEDLQSLYITGFDGYLTRARTNRRGPSPH